MIPDALCSVCHRAHPAEMLDALARCSTCIHDLGVADTIRPPARSPQASADCSREGCDRPAHPGAPMCIAHWVEMPTAQRALWYSLSCGSIIPLLFSISAQNSQRCIPMNSAGKSDPVNSPFL